MGGWIGFIILLILFPLTISKVLNRDNYTVIFYNGETLDENRLRYFADNQYYREREYEFFTMYSFPTDIVFVGDSLTQRCQWNELFPEYKVKNRGIGSDTTNGLLARLDSIIKTEPKILFVMIGINDIGLGIPEKETLNNISAIIEKLKTSLPESYIYVQSILPCGNEKGDLYNEVIQAYNKSIQQLVEGERCYYVDLYSLFEDENGYLKDEYNYDNVHITSSGYEIWYNKIYKICKGKLW